MAAVLQTKACKACALAKRRCGKQTPHCMRCKSRGIDCTYPPPKPTSFVPLEGEDVFPVQEPIPCPSGLELSTTSSDILTRGVDDAGLSALDVSGFSTDLISTQQNSSWFDSMETWMIYRFPQMQRNSFSKTDLERNVMKIHRWLVQWIEKGSNPFIHPQLYRTRFPRSVQDAYTTFSAYIHKTKSNQQIIFQIIEDRVKQLVQDPSNSTNLDSLEHLARVQALLIYQVICLYDGDIRLRHKAEGYISILNDWMHQMVMHASQAVCLGGSIISPAHEQMHVVPSMSEPQSENLLWYSWIVAESIRRTWLVASGIQAIYLAIQQDQIIPCMGGMMFTTRKGVWEAQSALAWEKICLEVNIGLIKMVDADSLFAEVEPGDVNDFSKMVLEITFGIEKMERWGVRIED